MRTNPTTISFRGIGKLKPDEFEIERREVEKGYGERHDGQGHRGAQSPPINTR